MCARARVCVPACVQACVRACISARVDDSVYLSVYVSVRPSVCPSACSFVCHPSVCPSLSVRPPVCPSVHLALHTCSRECVCMRVYLRMGLLELPRRKVSHLCVQTCVFVCVCVCVCAYVCFVLGTITCNDRLPMLTSVNQIYRTSLPTRVRLCHVVSRTELTSVEVYP